MTIRVWEHLYRAFGPWSTTYIRVAGVALVLFTIFQDARLEAEEKSRTSVPLSLTFEDFLRYPPTISNARYQIAQRELLYPLWMGQVKTNNAKANRDASTTLMANSTRSLPQVYVTNTDIYQLKWDNENYLLCRLDPNPGEGSGGNLDGLRWKLVANRGKNATNNPHPILILEDGGMTSSHTLSFDESFCKEIGRMLVNMGIYEMIPGSVHWQENGKRFTASYERPDSVSEQGQLTVELNYSNNVPNVATVRTDSGRTFVITYEYRDDFCQGRLPIAFTRYFDMPRGEEGKLYTIRILQLDVAPDSLPIAELDPREALIGTFESVIVISNGVSYSERGDSLWRIPTSADYIADMTRKRGLSLRLRSVLFCLVVTPLICLFMHTLRSRQLQNQQ